MHQYRTSRRGFTLIELLIVVAIIAILAAIAVPNFLEAQTRAKVSRVKADMRTLATALESYRVDNNRYVPTPTLDRTTRTQSFFLETRWAYLTTPISYVTSIIDDTFGDDDVLISDYRVMKRKAFDYSAFDQTGTYETEFFKQDLVQVFRFPEGITWLIASQGPDLVPGIAVTDPALGTISGRATGLPYDPTNGTVSAGDVIRVGPGGVNGGGT